MYYEPKPDGIKLSFLRAYLRSLDPSLNGATIQDICREKIRPSTVSKRCSYLDHLKEKIPSSLGTANVFISYTWSFIFTEFISTLLKFFENEIDDIVIWFDLFCINQHEVTLKDTAWLGTFFRNIISSIGRTVMVLSSWSEFETIKRGWCVWELYSTINGNCRFDIAMSPHIHQLFLDDLSSNPYTWFDTLCAKIDCSQLACTVPQDKLVIESFIVKGIGYNLLNKTIRDYIRLWALSKQSQSEVHQYELYGIERVDSVSSMLSLSPKSKR